MNSRRSRSSSRLLDIERAVVEAARRKEALVEKVIEQQKLVEPQRIMQQSVERRKKAVRRAVPVAAPSEQVEEEYKDIEPAFEHGGFDTAVAEVTDAYKEKVRIPILNRYDDMNKMEYGLFLTNDDIEQHVTNLRARMGAPVNSFQQELAQRFVNAQNINTGGSYDFSWHQTVTPVTNSNIPAPPKAPAPAAPLHKHWDFVSKFVEVRREHIENFVLPIIRSSCSPHCTFQNVGSDSLTADIDISVVSTRGGILKYMANYVTRVVFQRIGFTESVSLANGVVVNFNLGDLPSLMDTNVYPTGWYNICKNTSIAPFESCIDQNFFAPAAGAGKPAGAGYPFVACQLMWSMVRYVYALKYESAKQDSLPEEGHYFRYIVNLTAVLGSDKVDGNRSRAVEYAAKYLEDHYEERDDFYKNYVEPKATTAREVRFKSLPYLTKAIVERINQILIDAYRQYVVTPGTGTTDADVETFTTDGGKRNAIKAFITARTPPDAVTDWDATGSYGFFKLISFTDEKMERLSNQFYVEAWRRAQVMHKIRKDRKTQKVLAFLVQAVERCLRNYQTRTQVINAIFFAELKRREKDVEELLKAGDPLLQNRGALKAAKDAIKTYVNGGIFDTTKSYTADLEDMHKKMQTAFHFEYFTLQSMLYSFEEEAYLSIGAYLHVVIQEQKGVARDAYLGEDVYWMSFFDNLGFFYETHKLKYFDRMVNAIVRICNKNKITKNTPTGVTDAQKSKGALAEALTAIDAFNGVERTSQGFKFIKHCIEAFNHYAKTLTKNKCYRLLLSNESFEIGDIVVERTNPANEFIVVGDGLIDTQVLVREFDIDRTVDNRDRVIQLKGAAAVEKNIRSLRKKHVGFTIVPENYTFTNM